MNNNNHYNKQLKSLARKNRSDMTKAEVKIWNDLLRKKQFYGFRFLRQRPIKNYIVDFFCKELNLIIEIDGFSHHDEIIYLKDIKRQKELEVSGYHFLRFTDEEVSSDFDNVIRTMEIWLDNYKQQITHLNPPSREEISPLDGENKRGVKAPLESLSRRMSGGDTEG